VVQALLDEAGPQLGLPTLQACCPETPRAILAYLQAGYRRQFRQDHRLVVETLQWHRAGAVWAIDHSQPPRLVDGCYDQILAIRDLASGMQLAWTAVPDATAREALPVLETFVRQYGAPLVLKSDNGSAFISQEFQTWLADWRIVPLFSPVRMPRYNGACEAGIGGAKTPYGEQRRSARTPVGLDQRRSVRRATLGQPRPLPSGPGPRHSRRAVRRPHTAHRK